MSKSKLEALVVELRELIGSLRASQAELRATIQVLNSTVAARDARIAELEDRLGESRRAGKRQAAPFSKGDPAPEPKKQGRRAGAAYGRQVTRS